MKNRMYSNFDLRAKIIFTLLMTVLVFFITKTTSLLILSVLILVFSLFEVGIKGVKKNISLILAICVIMTLLVPLEERSGEPLIAFNNFVLVTKEGFSSYLERINRFFFLSFLYSLLITTSHFYDLAPALRFFRFPYSFILTISLALRFIPSLIKTFYCVKDSQSLRMSEGDKRDRIPLLSSLTSVLVIALKSITTTSQALLLRGVGNVKNPTSYRKLKSTKDVLAHFLLSVIISLILFILLY